MNNKLKVRGAVVVEGKYDKIKLSSIIDGVIITTDGFGIYNDKEKLELIRAYSNKDGVTILTDSDNAGRQIRNYLKQAVGGKLRCVYIPEICGKEKRKSKAAAQGLIGVEGIDRKILEKIFLNDNSHGPCQSADTVFDEPLIEREMLFDDGFIGGKNSSARRKALLRELDLPQNLSVTALLDVLNSLYKYSDYITAVHKLKAEMEK
ncbi:MAG: DUF4093 domain-containing protein [Oscillospiraceae bacterium]|nr:DUF4093 domain-containing protein [Oscillospiraceae bacterium]